MRRLLTLLSCSRVLGGGVYATYWWHSARPRPSRPPPAAGRRPRGGAASRHAGPGAGRAKRTISDVPIYLDALGTVQAFNPVSVRAMVDGPLVEVRFQEGQDVKAGDVLARIDPRPYQAALDSAVAKKQQDEANLANARLDVARYAKLVASNYSSAQQSDTARAQVAQLEAQVRGDQAQIDTAQHPAQLRDDHARRSTAGSACARSTAATSCMPGDTTPMTVITQLQPISVVFTLPQQSLPQVASAMQDGTPEVLALRQGSAPRRPADRHRQAGRARQPGRPGDRHHQAEGDLPQCRAEALARRLRQRPHAGRHRSAASSPCPRPPCSAGRSGAFVFVVKPDNTAQAPAACRSATRTTSSPWSPTACTPASRW